MIGQTWSRRMVRLFGQNGRMLVVALDHASVFGMMKGLEDPGTLLRHARQGGADAILTTYGIATRYAEEIADMGLILRVDGGRSNLDMRMERGPIELMYGVQDALRLGADAVGCMGLPGSRLESQTLSQLCDLVSQCAEWHVPVMAEMLPGGFGNAAQMWTAENIGHACRIAAELGADFVKTAYPGDGDGFRRALEQVYIPVLVLGGRSLPPGESSDRVLLQGMHDALQAGASGVAVGRNIFQHPQPGNMTAAIAALVHNDATVEEALRHLR